MKYVYFISFLYVENNTRGELSARDEVVFENKITSLQQIKDMEVAYREKHNLFMMCTKNFQLLRTKE